MRVALAVLMVAALGCRHGGGTALAPGQDAAAPDAAAGADGASDAAAPDVTVAAICPSVPHVDPRELALALLVGDEVIFLRADGSRWVVHRFDAGARERSLFARGPFLVAANRPSAVAALPEPVLPVLDVAVLDHAGQLRWRYTGTSINPLIHWDVFIAEDGTAALGIEGKVQKTIAIAADGTTRDLDGAFPLAAPTPGGGLLVKRWGTARGSFPVFGFIAPGATELRPLVLPLARNPSPEPLVRGDRFSYLGSEGGGLVLVDETLDGADRFPLAAPDDGAARLEKAGDAFLVTINGAARWLWRPAVGAPIELGGITATDAKTHSTDRWALVTAGKLPGWIVDLQGGQVRALTPPAGLPSPAEELRVSGAGSFFLGADGYRPLWRLDATTGAFTAIDLTPLLPLRPYPDARYCTRGPIVLEDGRIATGLRNDWMGGLYVGVPGQAPWTQLGLAVTGEGSVNGAPIGDSWIVWFFSFENSFCPSSREPWQAPPAGAPPLLSSTSTQFVPPGGEPLLIGPGTPVNFDRTRSCAEIAGVVHDLPTGTSVSLGPVSTAVWP